MTLRVFVTSAFGDTGEITAKTGEIDIHGASKESCRTLETSILRKNINPLLPGVNVGLGDTFKLLDKDSNTLFEGVIWEKETSTGEEIAFHIVCYDFVVYLNKSEPSVQVFENLPPQEIARQVCADLGLEIGEFAPGDSVTVNGRGMTGYDIIMSAYTKQSYLDGEKYRVRADGKKISVVKISENRVEPVIRELLEVVPGKLLEVTYRQSMDDLTNSLVVINETDGDSVESIDDSSSQTNFGKIQKLYRGDPKYLKEALEGAKTEASVDCISSHAYTTGARVRLESEILDGDFYIIGDKHSYHDGVHEVSLTLSSEYEMDTKDDEKESSESDGGVSNDTPEGQMYNLFRGMGYSHASASAIIANAYYESGLDPRVAQSGGPGMGLFQWSRGERWDKLVSWANSNGLDPYSIEGQVKFADYEMRTETWLLAKFGGIDALKKTSSVDKAHEIFYHGFERPAWNPANYNARLSKAKEYDRAFKEVMESRTGTGKFTWPIKGGGSITSGFGNRRGGFHLGVDIGAGLETPVLASDSGKVISAGNTREDWSYGNCIVIDHGNSYRTRYAHLNSIHVREGQSVKAGQTIGGVGSTGQSTGNHLHFEIIRNGQVTNPMNFF